MASQSTRRLQDEMQTLTDTVENLKISTLVNAAKISPLIQERTLGRSKSTSKCMTNATPSADQAKENRENLANNKQNGTTSTSKFRSDVWREVNIETEQNDLPRQQLQLSDCKLISFRLAANNAEKQRRARISQELQKKQNQLDNELEYRLQNIRIESAEEAHQRIQSKRQEREQTVREAMKQIEVEAHAAQEESNREKTKMIEHSRRLIECANKLKRQEELRALLEATNTNKMLFINLYEVFARTIINNKAILNQMDKLTHYTKNRDTLLQRYETLINVINSKQLSQAEMDAFEKLCADVKLEQSNLNNDIESFQNSRPVATTAVVAEPKTVVDAVPQIANGAPIKASLVSNTTATDGVVPTTLRTSTPLTSFASADRMAFYTETMAYYDEHQKQLQPLLDDPMMKKFRFNCQKAVNTPVNSISSVTQQHLKDKYDKLSLLISGNQVRVGDVMFSAAEHPLGVQYCTILLAKKFVNQATTISTSSNPQAAFPIAAVVVSIWQAFPHFGKLFLGILYKQCPFLVPLLMQPVQGQSEQEYLISLGYQYTDDKREPQDQYLKRLSGLQSIYSAILITKPRREQAHLPHPHGLENGWIWLTNFLNLSPLPEISATLLLEFIQVCGAEMWLVYKKQFTKLLLVMNQQYLAELDRVDSGGPNVRLKVLIENIIKDNRICPPSGTLPPNFW